VATEQDTRKASITPLQATIELAKRGRKELLPQLRQFLDEQPELWKHFGNIALQAQAAWLKLIGGTNLFMQETMTRFAEAQRVDLAGPDASPLERLMVERVVAINLEVGYYEALIAQHEGKSGNKVLDYLHRRHEVADGRLQAAMMNLARIRKLLPQVLKVDVVISGAVETTVKDATNDRGGEPSGNTPVRIRVPENRIKDLLAAASN
jgi:hypothetical protein